jgi:hypothetical protein
MGFEAAELANRQACMSAKGLVQCILEGAPP